MAEAWPDLTLSRWRDTCDTLHMWTQVVGKTALVLRPSMNQWWQVAFHVSSRGLLISPIPYKSMVFDAEFDFISHQLHIITSRGETRNIGLYPRSVASFYGEYLQTLQSLGIDLKLYTTPVEVPDPIPFEKDEVHASYDREYANRFWRVLVQVHRVLREFQARFCGKSSPVHFFWGSFDMALTRFSGRKGPVSESADPITREAYNEEVISCGFWPGDNRYEQAAFYAYAVPQPPKLREEQVRPAGAFYSAELGEFLLPYEEVRKTASPDKSILEFCESTYDAAARLANWNRQLLERAAA